MFRRAIRRAMQRSPSRAFRCSRRLIAPAIGASALLAGVLVQGFQSFTRVAASLWVRVRRPSVVAAGGVALVHGLLAAACAFDRSSLFAARAEAARRWALAAEI